jgi:translation initiation factor 3 subunit I
MITRGLYGPLLVTVSILVLYGCGREADYGPPLLFDVAGCTQQTSTNSIFLAPLKSLSLHPEPPPTLIAQTRYLMTGAADNTMRLWDVSTGKCLKTWEFITAVKRVAWNEDDSLVLSITEQRSGQPSIIRVFAINREDGADQPNEPISTITLSGPKATVALWAPLSETIITGHDNGKVAKYDAKTGEELKAVNESHRAEITDIQLSQDGTYFITSSKDKTARLFDIETLEEMKVFSTETPLNSACIAPLRPYVFLGGGQDAMRVTTTSNRQGKFEARFLHKIFEEEVGRVRGHL